MIIEIMNVLCTALLETQLQFIEKNNTHSQDLTKQSDTKPCEKVFVFVNVSSTGATATGLLCCVSFCDGLVKEQLDGLKNSLVIQ